MTELILDDLMRVAAEAGMAQAARGELSSQLLLTRAADGAVTIHLLSVPGVHPSTSARLAIAAAGPTHAVLVFEGYATQADPEKQPEKARLFANKVIRVSDLPPSERYDILMILGESRAGDQATRRYRITPAPPGGRRTFEPDPGWEQDGAVVAYDRFRPLFLSKERLLDLIGGRRSDARRD